MTERKNRLATSALIRRRLTAGVSGGGGGGPTAPSTFTAGMWTLTDLTTGGDARIAITSLPSDGGSAITDLEYKKDAGSWTSLSGTTTGNYDLTDVFTDGVSADVLIRAVNANGSGADSDTKSVTTTAASGITGHDTVHRVESTATAGSYNFTLNGITSGQLIHLPVKAMGDSTIHTPATWTVTLNGVAATFVVGAASGSSGTFPSVGVFRVVADATGNLALAITLNAAARACCVDARYLSGVHATPVVGTPQAPSGFNSDVNTLNVPTAYTPQAAGHVVLADIAIKGGDITSLAATSGADGAVYDETGNNATSDIETGAAYIVAADGSTPRTIQWDWTGADRCCGTAVEYQPA